MLAYAKVNELVGKESTAAGNFSRSMRWVFPGLGRTWAHFKRQMGGWKPELAWVWRGYASHVAKVFETCWDIGAKPISEGQTEEV